MAVFQDPQELVKDTPLLRLKVFETKPGVELYAKLELTNPAGGVKDRIGVYIVNEMLKSGQLKPGMTIIEATAGNTGLSLAFALCGTGIDLILVIPSKFSIEKQQLIRAMGVSIVNTPADGGMVLALEKAEELRQITPGSLSIDQFKNSMNPRAHYETTAVEIYQDLEGRIDYFVAGAGTGGTFSGIAAYLKDRNPAVKAILADPVGSILGQGEAGSYKIEGIGNRFIPDTLRQDLIDDVIKVNDQSAYEASRLIAQKTGIFAGSSSGANLAASLQLAETIERGIIVTIFYDRGERYLSQSLYDDKEENEYGTN